MRLADVLGEHFFLSMYKNHSCVMFVQVLLEAQEMAVKNHNVEFKSNLYVGESVFEAGLFLCSRYSSVQMQTHHVHVSESVVF